jgi:hypothetical protein
MTMAVAVFLSICAAGALLFSLKSCRRHRGQRPASVEKPSICMTTIDRLKSVRRGLSTSTSKEFSQLLADALRNYVHMAYKIPTDHRTSEEVVGRLLLDDPTNDWSVISLLAEVLKLADSVKFSPRELSTAQRRGMYKKACRLVLSSERFFRRRRTKGIVKRNKRNSEKKKKCG